MYVSITTDWYRLLAYRSTTSGVIQGNGAFSLTWQASMLIYWNKGSFYIRKEFNFHKIVLVHQNGRRAIVVEHQYGRRYVMWKRSVRYSLQRSFLNLRSGGVPASLFVCEMRGLGLGLGFFLLSQEKIEIKKRLITGRSRLVSNQLLSQVKVSLVRTVGDIC